jgi:hypothetical protein
MKAVLVFAAWITMVVFCTDSFGKINLERPIEPLPTTIR